MVSHWVPWMVTTVQGRGWSLAWTLLKTGWPIKAISRSAGRTVCPVQTTAMWLVTSTPTSHRVSVAPLPAAPCLHRWHHTAGKPFSCWPKGLFSWPEPEAAMGSHTSRSARAPWLLPGKRGQAPHAMQSPAHTSCTRGREGKAEPSGEAPPL